VRPQQPGLALKAAAVAVGHLMTVAAIFACVSHTASVLVGPIVARCLAVGKSIGLAQCPYFRHRPCTLGFRPWHRLSP